MSRLRGVLNWYARLTPGRNYLKPPYKHVTQIGDPVLRKVSAPVEINLIKTKQIQSIVRRLQHVLDKYDCVGMSAPQIGINLRIIAFQYTQRHTQGLSNEYLKTRQISLIPFTVIINPTMRVLDYSKITLPEGCESVKGLSANVARYQTIEVSGYNEDAEPLTREYHGWSARIAQHEIDHLDGKLYTDVMDRKSLHCTCWEEINKSGGKIVLPYLHN